MLIDIFVRIEGFFKRLESYTEVQPTDAMTDVIMKIMIEVLSILAIATKQIKRGRSSELIDIQNLLVAYLFSEQFLKKLLGKNDIEDALKKLDTLTTGEARMAIAETLKVTNRVDDKVSRVEDKMAVLIDGGKCVSLIFYVSLKMNMARCERSKRSHTPFDKHRRRRKAFVFLNSPPLLYGLIFPLRETVTKGTAKLAFPPGSLHKSQYRTQDPPRGNSVLVFPRRYFQTVEVVSVSSVDPWQTYVPFSLLYLTLY